MTNTSSFQSWILRLLKRLSHLVHLYYYSQRSPECSRGRFTYICILHNIIIQLSNVLNQLSNYLLSNIWTKLKSLVILNIFLALYTIPVPMFKSRLWGSEINMFSKLYFLLNSTDLTFLTFAAYEVPGNSSSEIFTIFLLHTSPLSFRGGTHEGWYSIVQPINNGP